MTDEAWNPDFVRCLGVRLAGDAMDEVDERGEKITGDTLLLLLNSHHETIAFTLPSRRPEQQWECVLDTTQSPREAQRVSDAETYPLRGRSMAVLRLKQPADQRPT